MATYVSFLRFTEQGIRTFKEGPTRVENARKAFHAAGAELKQFFLVMGKYDMVIVSEAPNDETVAKIALSLGAQGNVRTETMRVFTEPEYRKIIDSLK